jgi:hypothetical protein
VSSSAHAYPLDGAEVDAVGMEVALAHVSSRFPGHVVTQMPHNNPGYDILVGLSAAPVRYVEVKSTRADAPVFNLSEGERRFSVAHAPLYSLLVITGIDIEARTYLETHWYDGALTDEEFQLRPLQWRGRGPSQKEG